MTHDTTNVDQSELAKFSALAHRWWDPLSDFKPLHDINPLRLDYIEQLAGGIATKRVADVGCGGGILSEAMARLGASVTGIDLSEKPLKVAQLHLLESGFSVHYELNSPEEKAKTHAGEFDVVTCMELLEHVPDPASTIAACATLVKPGGHVFFSTINRNPKSYLFAVVGAEYLLKMLPKGTHDYARFIKPSELSRWCRDAGLQPVELKGMTYNPVTDQYRLGENCDVNYSLCCAKDA